MLAHDLGLRFRAVRERSLSVCAPLTVEDHQLQSMADASPAKWHLAHTSWFFEAFVLGPRGVAPYDEHFNYVFNSYYEAVGPRHERARRGLVSRPGLAAVHAYRAHVDDAVGRALDSGLPPEACAVIELGLHHEQQHQELMLTDAKHALATQPLRPAYRSDLARAPGPAAPPVAWHTHAGGVVEIGATGSAFAFDNERPRHRTFLEPFALASRPLANAEVLGFIAAGGYREPRLWLSDGYATAQREGWRAPLYWDDSEGGWQLYDLTGMRAVDPGETACHLSFYEADAIARWSGARLPTEAEWELAATAAGDPRDGHWADDDRLHPRVATGDGLAQLFGDIWEWTQSAYTPYPGFRPLAGALGEYNGKFMSGQMVLRGGSCFTPRDHARATYRNFFPPATRWQLAGARLARDGGQ